jgi:secondary thiamine-phosphate synthase enzyme
MIRLKIKTSKNKEIIDITNKIKELVLKEGKGEGLCNIFLMHTTSSLMLADLDPGGTDMDYLDAFSEMVPQIDFRHPHNPNHMPDHILSSLIGVSLNIPFKNGALILGEWQRIILVEFDGPREREFVVTFIENKIFKKD